ncbi:hypothetical protein BC938DRAFT_482562 [Jimgerdemannia flammicorona]|nr:hypothetical protein BC938DRAFT_482562 [Jimgerdemannia flammicorona]
MIENDNDLGEHGAEPVSESERDELADVQDGDFGSATQPTKRKRPATARPGPAKAAKTPRGNGAGGNGQAWLPHDMLGFFNAIEKHGTNWTAVGKEIGRPRTSCQAKWKQVRRQFEG